MHEIAKNSPVAFQNINKQTSLKLTRKAEWIFLQMGLQFMNSLGRQWLLAHPSRSEPLNTAENTGKLAYFQRHSQGNWLSDKSQLPCSLGLKTCGNLPRCWEWSCRISADGIGWWDWQMIWGNTLGKLSLSFPTLKSFKPRWRHCGRQRCICPLCQQFTPSE